MAIKLIEVALPLTAINEATAAEKRTTARLAHPAKIHQWWARRPLIACRAVLFAQLVDDPSAHPDRFPTPEAVDVERDRLFAIMRSLLDLDGPSPSALRAAKEEIRRSVGDDVTITDPFAGGGAIPIEAQRLGLSVVASDLNPVAVLLNRLLLDQVRVALGRSAVHPNKERLLPTPAGSGLAGLAEDIIWYGGWILSEVAKTLAPLYPPETDEDGRVLPVVAWLWARQTECTNPACRAAVPLISTLLLSKKAGRQIWLEPQVDQKSRSVHFSVMTGTSGPVGRPSKTGRGPRFTCFVCQQAMSEMDTHGAIDEGRFTYRLLAVVMKGDRQRVYRAPKEVIVTGSRHDAVPDGLEAPCRGTFGSNAQGRRYGFRSFADYFTPRQLVALSTFTDQLRAARLQVLEDSGGDEAYADLIVTVLGICISKQADSSNSLCRWLVKDQVPVNLFSRQAVSMVWDFPEANILGDSSGSWTMTVANVARSISGSLVDYPRMKRVSVEQANAATRSYPSGVVVSTDPPYFDNISYADLSDFFYVWLRLGLKDIHPDLFSTLLTPKTEELVASPHRFEGSQDAANDHFEGGFRQIFSIVKQHHHPDVPFTVFYAYKQEDEEFDDEGGVSGAGATGWEKLLQGMVDTGVQVTATWPIRTEMGNRMISLGTNALASSVVLACRPRPVDAGITDRQGFIRHLRRVLGEKLIELQSGGVQPVDMAQASIGPGMAVFTSYAKVIDGADRIMSVGTALQLINQVLDELQTEQESEFDSDTRWAVSWFDQFGMNSGDFGDAHNVATARGTAMNALERAGIVESRAGRVRLLDRGEYEADWDPTADKRLTVWEVCQHLIRRVEGDGGLPAAAALLRQVGGLGDAARDLAYRLYEIANRKGWADEARAYNNLAAEWPDLVALAAQAPSNSSTLF